MLDSYTSPFASRYSSKEMSFLFSSTFKITTFRRLWIALASAQRELGLPISLEQIEEMQTHMHTIDEEAIFRHEKQLRHETMAHIRAFGDLCPLAKPIIHLGATSSYVTDNADLIQMKEAMRLLHAKMILLLQNLARLAELHKKDPTLSYTHYQPAQPTTIGKRICLWLQDFYHDALEWERLESNLPFLGVKGATGSQASFLALFESDGSKVKKLEELISKSFGFSLIIPIASQTYPRKIDLTLVQSLASFAASSHKMATDLRLLAHDEEWREAFEESQVGSSAMPYKQNPIYAERICALARFVLSLSQNPAYTAATQWLERSLDDSANRKLSIPEAFLGADAILNLLLHLTNHIEINTELAKKHLEEKAPFLAMENLLMAAVKKGGDRQNVHEVLRKIARAAKKEADPTSFFIKGTSSQLDFSEKEAAYFLKVEPMLGRSVEQVEEFLKDYIKPYLIKQKQSPLSFPKIDV